MLQGFLNVKKDSGMSSHDVVARVRKLSGVKQVGHAGTLDPLATGVLVLAVGKTCRLLRFLSDDKIYLASVLFGASTDTDDLEGKLLQKCSRFPDESQLKEAIKKFTGNIEQTAPLYSAVHVAGKRLYQLAREDKAPEELPSRAVRVDSIEMLAYEAAGPDLLARLELDAGRVAKLRIKCGAGTYIRSIARDLGQALSSQACLVFLERERAGVFSLSDSHSLADLAEAASAGSLSDLMIAPESVLNLPAFYLNEEESKRLCCGQRLKIELSRQSPVLDLPPPASFRLAFHEKKLIAVCSGVETETDGSFIVELKPEVVLTDGSLN